MTRPKWMKKGLKELDKKYKSASKRSLTKSEKNMLERMFGGRK